MNKPDGKWNVDCGLFAPPFVSILFCPLPLAPFTYRLGILPFDDIVPFYGESLWRLLMLQKSGESGGKQG